MTTLQHFHAAAFAIDGELIGTKTRRFSELSAKWLALCSDMVETNGAAFSISLGQMLSHITIKLTSADGAALVEFSVHGIHTLSAAYFSGLSTSAERQVQEMLLSSLRQSTIVQQAASTDAPFQALLGISDRPLCALIFFASAGVSEQDNNLVTELSEHLAGAYFASQWQNVA
jgi:hypothetical protein